MAKRTVFRVLVTLHFLKFNVSELMSWGDSALDLITGNPDIPNPVVPVADARQRIADLRLTYNARQTSSSTSLTDTEKAQINLVLNDFTYYAAQIETIANMKVTAAGGDVNVGRAFVSALSFVPKNAGIRPGRSFEVTNIESPGKCSLICPAAEAGKKVIYFWRYTTTPADQSSWSVPIQTTVSTINLIELEGDTRYYFQHAVVLDAGKGNVIDVTNLQIPWVDTVISGLIPGPRP